MDWPSIGVAVLAAVVIVAGSRFIRPLGGMSQAAGAPAEESLRAKISSYMLIGSLALLTLIVLLAFLPIFQLSSLNQEVLQRANALSERVMVVILPLIGTWVGTILAFYFSKENFESASRAQERILDRTMQRLEQTSAESVMLPYDKILGRTTLTAVAGENQVLVKDLLEKLRKHNVARLIFDDEQGRVKYVIHDSLFFRDAYLHLPTPGADEATAGGQPDRTLKQLLDETSEDNVSARDFATAFVILSRSASLADCQRAMEQQPRCRDVFLTASGSTERPLGWVTDQDVRANAKV